jgi:hypothetical protein
MTSPTTFANFGPARSTHPRDLFLSFRPLGESWRFSISDDNHLAGSLHGLTKGQSDEAR